MTETKARKALDAWTVKTETKARKALDAWTVKTYLDWVNNYLTIEKMAGDYNLSPSGMKVILEKGKELYEA